jgi:alkylation response protein AidB-like acyl-CoA dehydrogenase
MRTVRLYLEQAPMSAVARVLIFREFGRSILPFAPVTVPSLMAGTPYAGEIMAGDLSLSLAFEQIHPTGTLDEVTTSYRRVADGFVLCASRMDILNPGADLFLLPARLEGSAQVGLFLIAAEGPGVCIEAEEDLTTDATIAWLSLNQCVVGMDRLLGYENEIEAIVASEQLRIAARCLEEAQPSLSSARVLTSSIRASTMRWRARSCSPAPS